MSQTEKDFSEKESLELITSMINKVKASYHDTGIGPILWGTVVTVCGIVSFFGMQYKMPGWQFVWMLTIVAIVPQVIISMKEKKERKFTSYNDEAASAIWMTFGGAMFMLAILDSIASLKIHASIYMLVYGIPTIITGMVLKFKSMLWGGLCCWAFSIASVFFSYPYPFLFTSASAIAAWLIPGIIINNAYRKQKAANV
jgi:hypothetical protein